MPEETAPTGGDGIIGVVRVWADAEVTHGPNWVEPDDEEKK